MRNSIAVSRRVPKLQTKINIVYKFRIISVFYRFLIAPKSNLRPNPKQMNPTEQNIYLKPDP